eukprot:4938409-Prymnesium_polylepis.1
MNGIVDGGGGGGGNCGWVVGRPLVVGCECDVWWMVVVERPVLRLFRANSRLFCGCFAVFRVSRRVQSTCFAVDSRVVSH